VWANGSRGFAYIASLAPGTSALHPDDNRSPSRQKGGIRIRGSEAAASMRHGFVSFTIESFCLFEGFNLSSGKSDSSRGKQNDKSLLPVTTVALICNIAGA